MARRIDKVALVTVILLVLGTSLPYGALAQSKAPVSVGELLKSIGLTKPALSRAPDFNLRDAGGGTSSLTAHRGSLVLLNFWATWCGPCREEMPSMDQLSRNFGGQGLVVVAVNQRESAAQVNRFMKTNRLSFSTPLDTDGRVAASYRVFGIPATYLIDGSGQPIGMKSGPMDWAASDVVNVFRKLMSDASSATVAGPMNLEPAVPLPNTLRAKANGISVHVQQDPYSEAISKLERGEELSPLGKVSGAGEFWYMVKTKNGAVGWVRGSDVEEVRTAK
ncbi:MAG TPA: redoxin domain-containing protein [Candidatus Binatia bacterium]|nr:redoxin domain-containing protein [Candidatus Binatia bacterium]